jgi:hypothetical protein
MPKELLMSRVLIASCWMLVPLGLCSCVDDTDVRPAPAPIVKPTTDVEPLPVKQEVVEPLAESGEQQPAPEPSSGNPLIDLFRSVDRGVKSTTENGDGPESGGGNKPADK